MAIFCSFCVGMYHELFALYSRNAKRKSFALFLFYLFVFYCSRRAKNYKDMDYFWQIYCQSCANRRKFLHFYSIKWAFYINNNTQIVCFHFFFDDTHRGAKYERNHENMDCSLVKRCTYVSWISCDKWSEETK